MKNRFVLACIYITLTIIAISLSIAPDIYRARITPPGTIYPLIHNHPNDYFSYLGYMHMGYEGKWLVTHRVSPEHFKLQFVYIFFVFLGHFSRITGISLVWMYFIARIVFGGLLLYGVYHLAGILFPKTFYRLLAFCFVTFGTGFWTLVRIDNSYQIIQYMTFWSRFNPILRTAFLPHHTASTAAALFSLVFLISSFKQRSFLKAFLAGLLGMFAGLVYHGTMLNLIGGIGVAAMLLILVSFFSKISRLKHIPHSPLSRIARVVPFTSIFVLLSAFSLIYTVYLTTTTWPWTGSANLAGRFSFAVSLKDYLLALGPMLVLTILGISRVTRSTSLLPFILLGWSIFPFIGLFFLVQLVPRYGNMPYFEATTYIPLGILAVYGIQTLEHIFKRRITTFFILLFLLLYSLPPIYDSVKRQMALLPPNNYNAFIPHNVLDGFNYLEYNTPNGSTVLSGGLFGPILPAFSHNYTVYGDEINTYKAEEKHADMLAFFSQKDPQAALSILKKYNVSYVFFSYDTDPPTGQFLQQLPLTKVYENGRVVIFKVAT